MPKRVSPKEAADLLQNGHSYIDVRSIPEYEQGHPVGARNIPFMHFENGRMVLNRDFLAVFEKLYPKDSPLVVGCKAGGRSLQAVTLLERNGYTHLVDMRGGFDAEIDPHTGQIGELGWSRVGLPVEKNTAGGDWTSLSAAAKTKASP